MMPGAPPSDRRSTGRRRDRARRRAHAPASAAASATATSHPALLPSSLVVTTGLGDGVRRVSRALALAWLLALPELLRFVPWLARRPLDCCGRCSMRMAFRVFGPTM